MISVLFIILKIIGITLLAILSILLLLLLLVLLVPIRYRLNGGYENAFCCNGKVTWLLHFLSVRIHVDEKVNTDIRILGIPISFFRKKKKKRNVENENPSPKESFRRDTSVTGQEKQPDLKNTEAKRTVAESAKQTEVPKASVESAKQIASEQSKTGQKQEQNVSLFEKTGENIKGNYASMYAEEMDAYGDTENDGLQEASEGNQKKSFLQKIKEKLQEIVQKIKDVLNKMKNLIGKIKEFIQNARDKKTIVKRWLKILQSDTAKAAFALCKDKLLLVLKHVMPKKMVVNIHYGFEDPADTGYTLAVYGMMPQWIGKRLVLHPDFNKNFFQCDFRLKGKIRMGTLLYQILCVIRDKNCKRLYHIVKKEIEHERK